MSINWTYTTPAAALAELSRATLPVRVFDGTTPTDPTLDAFRQVALSAIGDMRVLAAGADPTGTAGSADMLAAVDSLGPVYIPAGTFKIDHSLAFSNRVKMAAGAQLIIGSGVTVAFNGGFDAPPVQVFKCSGTGSVQFDSGTISEGYADWWGASGDATAAINAALVAVPVVKLLRRDYVVTDTVVVPAYRRLEGASSYYEGSQTATRLLMVGGTKTVVLIGTLSYPGTINACPRGGQIANLYVSRNTLPVLASACECVVIGYSREAAVENVLADGSIRGFRLFGAVAPTIRHSRAKRSVLSSTNPGDGSSDQWRGFYIDGSSVLGASGANASVRIYNCFSDLNVNITDSVGLSADKRMTDMWVEDFETVGAHAVGIDITGDKSGSPALSSNTDIQLLRPRVDQTTTAGIRIQYLNKWGSAEIAEAYIGAASGGSIILGSNDGTVAIRGGQFAASLNTAPAIDITSCRSTIIDSPIIAECAYPAVRATTVSGLKVAANTINETATLPSVVQLNGTCEDFLLSCGCEGTAKVTIGYELVGTAANYGTLDVSRLRKTALTGTTRNARVKINGKFPADSGYSALNNTVVGPVA